MKEGKNEAYFSKGETKAKDRDKVMINDDEMGEKYRSGNLTLLKNDALDDSTKVGITPNGSSMNLHNIPSKGNKGGLEIERGHSKKVRIDNDNSTGWSLALIMEAQKRLWLIVIPTLLASLANEGTITLNMLFITQLNNPNITAGVGMA